MLCRGSEKAADDSVTISKNKTLRRIINYQNKNKFQKLTNKEAEEQFGAHFRAARDGAADADQPADLLCAHRANAIHTREVVEGHK